METGCGIDSPVSSLCNPLLAPSYHEDLELQIRYQCLRDIADRIELAHYQMLEEHDRRTIAIAEQAPHARHIPFYPELPPENDEINHTVQTAPSVRARTISLRDCQKQPTAEFSKMENYLPVNGTTKLVLVIKDDKWFCNLFQAEWMPEMSIEEHTRVKRHKQNLQAQVMSHRSEPVKPPARLHRCFTCNITCTSENNLVAHYNGKKHIEALKKGVKRYQ